MKLPARLLIALFAATLAAPVWAQGVPFTSGEGKFSITFPAKPEHKTEKPQSGEVNLFVVNQGARAWLASYSERGSGAAKSAGAGADLERWAGSAASGGKLRRSSKLTVAGHPAREVLVELDNGMVRLQRGIIAGPRLYQVLYVGPAGSERAPEVKRFFDSFRLRK